MDNRTSFKGVEKTGIYLNELTCEMRFLILST